MKLVISLKESKPKKPLEGSAFSDVYICHLRVMAVRIIEDDEFPGCDKCFEEHHPYLQPWVMGYIDTKECRGDHAELFIERADNGVDKVQRHSMGGCKRG